MREADADVVGVQEPEGNLRRLAAATGMPYVDDSLHLISRYPLFAVGSGAERFAYVGARPRPRRRRSATCISPAAPTGPRRRPRARAAKRVLRARALAAPARDPALRAQARSARASAACRASSRATSTRPRISTGPRPSPRRARERVPFALDWPVSRALARAGFSDSYREAHPDPVATPGYTWTPGTPAPRIRRKETLDRIDWVMAGGRARTLAARLVGEAGGPDVDVGLDPYGSDHRAVASTFAVTPGARAGARERRAARRHPRRARQRPLHADARRRGQEDRDPARRASRSRRSRSTTRPTTSPRTSAPGRCAPGAYRAALLRGDGSVAASYRFWIEAPGTRPSIRATQHELRPRRADRAALRRRARQQARLGRHLPRRRGRPLPVLRLQVHGRAPERPHQLHEGRPRDARARPLPRHAHARRRLQRARRRRASGSDERCAVRTEVRGHVLEVVLDRPKANAIDRATGLELYEAFARLRDDPELRVGILTGARRALLLGGLGPEGGGRRRGGHLDRLRAGRLRRPDRDVRSRQAGDRGGQRARRRRRLRARAGLRPDRRGRARRALPARAQPRHRAGRRRRPAAAAPAALVPRHGAAADEPAPRRRGGAAPRARLLGRARRPADGRGAPARRPHRRLPAARGSGDQGDRAPRRGALGRGDVRGDGGGQLPRLLARDGGARSSSRARGRSPSDAAPSSRAARGPSACEAASRPVRTAPSM